MKVLVTGAAGFIGSHVARDYARLGAQVTCIDNLNSYYSAQLKRMRVEVLLNNKEIDFQEVDLTNQEKIDSLVSSVRPHAVVHLAAQAGVRLPITETHKYVSSNLTGFSNILKSSIHFEIPTFIYASSSSVYGNSPNIPYKEIEQGLKPTSFYGATKLSNELLASALSRNTKTSTRGLRFFTVYGPWGRPDMAYFRMIRNLILDHEFYLYGDGTLKRDFTYIDDAVDSVLSLTQQASNQKFPFSDVVNIGGGNDHSILELISLVNKLGSKNLKIQFQEGFTGDVKQTLADSSRLFELVGKIPTTKLPEGIKKFYQWCMSDSVVNLIKNWE